MLCPLTPSCSMFLLLLPPPPSSTLFPYTTLFRSRQSQIEGRQDCRSLRSNSPPQRRISLNNIRDRKSTRLNSSHANSSYAVFCLKKKRHRHRPHRLARPS